MKYLKYHLRERKLKDGRVSFYADGYNPATRKRVYTPLDIFSPSKKTDLRLYNQNKNLSMKKMAELQSQVNYESAGLNKPNQLFLIYLDKFLSTRVPEKNRNYFALRLDIADYTKDPHFIFEKITPVWLEDYKQHLLKAYTNNTASCYFTKLSSVLNQAVRDGIITSNPINKVKSIPMQETKREYLTVEELQIIAQSTCKHPIIKKAFLFACQTGLRISDIEKLTYGDIQNNKIALQTEKTKEIAYIDLSETARSLIYDSNIKPLPNVKVFEGLPPKENINRELRKWLKPLNLNKNISFHCSRHTFATLLLSQGVSIEVVSKLLNHKDLKTTQIYAKVVDSRKTMAINSLPKLNLSNL